MRQEPEIRSSRVIQMVAACGTWHFGLQVWCGAVGCVSGLRDVSQTSRNQSVPSSWPFIFYACIWYVGSKREAFRVTLLIL